MTDPYESLEEAVVVDRDGKEVGQVLEVHRDAFSGRPAWVAVKGGLLHGKSLVPVGDAEPVDGKLQVPYDAATIRKAPYVDLTAEQQAVEEEASREGISESIEERDVSRRNDHWEVYEYYGVPFGRPDKTGAASPEAEFGFGSAGTSPKAEGSTATPEEIIARHPEAADAYPEGTLDDESARASGGTTTATTTTTTTGATTDGATPAAPGPVGDGTATGTGSARTTDGGQGEAPGLADTGREAR
jgi:hypothetical protein